MKRPLLAQFVSALREKTGLTQAAFAKRCSLDLETVENIENGTELFLSSTVRQKLAKGLKLNPQEIKPYEVEPELNFATNEDIERIQEEILNKCGVNKAAFCKDEPPIACPVCGEGLMTRVAKMLDLEDVPQYHPKAYCPKCPFQIR